MINNPDDIEGINRSGPTDYYNQGYQPQQYYQKPQKQQVYDPISKKDATDRWKNRRRMAYAALLSIFVVTMLLFFVVPAERLEPLGNVSEWYFIVMGSVVASYVGSASWSDIVELKNRVGRR